MTTKQRYTVVDLFSGAGGMSYGFHRHAAFDLLGAADAEIGKPSAGSGSLQCNNTYARNMGTQPLQIDLGTVAPKMIRSQILGEQAQGIDVLCVCPPCTGFSRTNPANHLIDDGRNGLVMKAAGFAETFGAKIVLMENARELISGNFRHHFDGFARAMQRQGFRVHAENYLLSRFGLPQIRERAIVVCVRESLPLHTLPDLWNGWHPSERATTVRRAFEAVDRTTAEADLYPSFASEYVRNRMRAIPRDGGSWSDLLGRKDADLLLTDAMKRIVAAKRMGSYPDVYGRMAWERPAPTIKRECAHVGNGRYAHPEEDRLCSVREMAMLQGFPNDFTFGDTTLANMYRHIGDAVPPLISYQLAQLSHWILTGKKPSMRNILLPGTSVRLNDLVRTEQEALFCA